MPLPTTASSSSASPEVRVPGGITEKLSGAQVNDAKTLLIVVRGDGTRIDQQLFAPLLNQRGVKVPKDDHLSG